MRGMAATARQGGVDVGADAHPPRPGRRTRVMSAPAAKIRSPPVTTTAPGGSSVSASAACPQLRPQRRGDGVDLRVVQRDHRHAVVASLQVHQLVGHDRPTLRRLSPVRASRLAEEDVRRRPWVEPALEHGLLQLRRRSCRAQLAGPEPRGGWRRSGAAPAGCARPAGAPADRSSRRTLRWSWTASHSSATPVPVDGDGGHDRRAPLPQVRTGRASAPGRAGSRPRPGRSALLMTKTSAISIRPALLACTPSPQPGLTTTTVVSAWPAISTST